MATTRKVSKQIYDFSYDQIPPRGIEQAKAAIIDAVGVSFWGGEEHVEQELMKLFSGGAPEARIWATGEKTTLLNAVMVNSACVHAIDYDNGGSLGHPSCLLVPALLGLAEIRRFTGRQLLEAYTVGVELGGRLRESLGDLQHGAGYHATSLLGPMVVAAACAKLMGMDADGIQRAISLAAPLGAGMVQSFGTDAKPLQVARASQNGVMAALLAEQGCSGDPEVLEERKGFYFVYGQEIGASIKELTSSFGQPVILAKERGHFKQWPCCGGNYEPLSAVTDMVAENTVDPENIARIVVSMSMQPPGPALRVYPRTPEEGRFCIPYNVATAIVDGDVTLDSYSEENFSRPIIHELMKKTELVWSPEVAGKPKRLQGESRFVDVYFYMKDGTVLSRHQDGAKRKQLTAEQVYEKYAANASHFGKDSESIEKAQTLMRNFETCEKAAEFLDIAAF